MEATFRAYVLEKRDQEVHGSIQELTMEQLPEGTVTIAVHYSGVNYKDGLASIANGKVVQRYPFVPGIDLAGEVVASQDERYQPGDLVLCTGYKLGVSHDGGYSEYARVPGDWLVPLRAGLQPKEAMMLGTAGFTAAMSVDALIGAGIQPASGPVLVTGATGGVGSVAISILSKLGYEVHASSGKAEQSAWLKQLGAAHTVTRQETEKPIKGALGQTIWAGIVDATGGAGLGERLKTVAYRGAVAVSGNTAGVTFESSVFPFILRGVQLIGIDSVYCPAALRLKLWHHLATDWKPDTLLRQGVTEYRLDDVQQALQTVLAGQAVGRQIIRISDRC
ncbi:acryloyl-CoA reductase [Paenibacillus campi]|uniref:acrylyl-CoA reductase family protein n=1 Tax=Paenibacillus campi TaxID=3106031 RepID=UPI002AFE7F08|nr:acryloyl-CoA reductase [Paenibacillus sp. SGZ-1014]